MIRIMCISLLLGGLVACSSDKSMAPTGQPAGKVAAVTYGADNSGWNFPIGGGSGYASIVTSGDVTVSNYNDLKAALNNQANIGKTVFISASNITFPNQDPIPITVRYVTVAGNRGQGQGALLRTSGGNGKLFVIKEPGVRITGLRLQGPNNTSAIYSNAIQIQADRAEVDNCDISYWMWSGIVVQSAEDAHIHHNLIRYHYVDPLTLGYGVSLEGPSDAVVEANHFYGNKHDVVSEGNTGSSVIIRHNLMYSMKNKPSFDVHGECETGEGSSYWAGGYFNVHNNNFYDTPPPSTIYIRGYPYQMSYVRYNRFSGSTSDAVLQVNPSVSPSGNPCPGIPSQGNITESDNQFNL